MPFSAWNIADPAALRLQVKPELAGSRYAIRVENDLFFSPAMHALAAGAESDEERQRVLDAIEVIQLPRYPWHVLDFQPAEPQLPMVPTAAMMERLAAIINRDSQTAAAEREPPA